MSVDFINMDEALDIDCVEQLSDSIAVFYNNENLSDVKLIVDNVEIPAHKFLLAARSQFFRAIFYGELRERSENQIKLNETSIEPFKVLLKYAYSGTMHFEANQIDLMLDVLGMADKYAFVEVVEEISVFLKTFISDDNACEIFTAATLYNQRELKEEALKVIDYYPEECFDTQGFLNLPYKDLIEIIERDTLTAEEFDIFKAVVRWVEHNNLEETKIPTLLKNIRLSLIDYKILVDEVWNSRFYAPEEIIESINLQQKPGALKHRAKIALENVAKFEFGAEIINGSAYPKTDDLMILFDGNLTTERYVSHKIGISPNEKDGSITIQLDKIYFINSLSFLLWNGGDRSYSYYVEVSNDFNTLDKNKICDNKDQKAWQHIKFKRQTVQYIRIVGTHNTANNHFHIIHFECPSTRKSL